MDKRVPIKSWKVREAGAEFGGAAPAIITTHIESFRSAFTSTQAHHDLNRSVPGMDKENRGPNAKLASGSHANGGVIAVDKDAAKLAGKTRKTPKGSRWTVGAKLAVLRVGEHLYVLRLLFWTACCRYVWTYTKS